MKNDEPMRNINPFGLRMQPEIKLQLEASAKANKRSLNAEIIARLERTLAEDHNLEEMADYQAWLDDNPHEAHSGETIVGLLAHLRSLVSSAESSIRAVERLYDEKTGEHAITADEHGNIIKSYER